MIGTVLPLAIRLFLGGKALIARAFAWATASTARLLALALAAALVWGWLGHHKSGKLAKVLASTEQGYRNAQADAKLAQDAMNAAITDRSAAIAKESTYAHVPSLASARSAVADYARRNPARMRCETNQGGTSGSDAPALPATSGVATNPGGQADMVAIAVADLDKLASATVRAESCRALGQAWIDGGLAEVVE